MKKKSFSGEVKDSVRGGVVHVVLTCSDHCLWLCHANKIKKLNPKLPPSVFANPKLNPTLTLNPKLALN